MPTDKRKKILNALAVFRDPKQMRSRYGISINKEQIAAADAAMARYKAMSDNALKNLDEAQAMRWPYVLTERQRYDKLLYQKPISIPQAILWNHIRGWLVNHPDERKTDGDAIVKALGDMEGFLKLNLYKGEFEENRKLIDGENNEQLIRLFTLSYTKYATEN